MNSTAIRGLGDDASDGVMERTIIRVKEADEEAERGALAFLLGRFPEYWRVKGEAAIHKLQERYAELGGDQGGGVPGDQQTSG